jgi:hypothetical protein
MKKNIKYLIIKKLYNINFINIFKVLLKSNKNNQIILYNNVFKTNLINYINNKKEKVKIKANIKTEYFYERNNFRISFT